MLEASILMKSEDRYLMHTLKALRCASNRLRKGLTCSLAPFPANIYLASTGDSLDKPEGKIFWGGSPTPLQKSAQIGFSSQGVSR